jgi:hypothetical protein
VKTLVLLLTMIFGLTAFAMPQVWMCDTPDGSEFALKGFERSDNGEGFKSYTMVDLDSEAAVVLSVGALGQSEADGFVAFSGYMDQFTESMIDRLCSETPKQGSTKTVAIPLNTEGQNGRPICMSCFEQ